MNPHELDAVAHIETELVARARVLSRDRSSTTTTSKFWSSSESFDSVAGPMSRSSSRAGTMTETNGPPGTRREAAGR